MYLDMRIYEYIHSIGRPQGGESARIRPTPYNYGVGYSRRRLAVCQEYVTMLVFCHHDPVWGSQHVED